MAETFGELLKRLRAARGLTAYDVARAIEVSPAAVSRWESDQRRPHRTHVEQLAGALRLTADDRDHLYVLAGFVPPEVEPAALLAACRAIRRAAS